MKKIIAASVAALSLTTLVACGTPSESSQTTPHACLTALDDAEHLESLTVEALDSAGNAMRAAASYDAAGIDAETAKMEALTPKVAAARAAYETSAAECRSQS